MVHGKVGYMGDVGDVETMSEYAIDISGSRAANCLPGFNQITFINRGGRECVTGKVPAMPYQYKHAFTRVGNSSYFSVKHRFYTGACRWGGDSDAGIIHG
jgi:hypothetical protein